MLGFRGCRLGVAYPEIAEMQAAPSSRRREIAGQDNRQAGPVP
jgi:phosphoenolpyruvate synthase/pyruvate phosphate dikinase